MHAIETPELFAAAEATWPAAARDLVGPWIIRSGPGGGSRVNAATAAGPVGAADLPLAEAEMRARGQQPLFMLREGEAALDSLLAAAGYAVKDPVVIRRAPVQAFAKQDRARGAVYEAWPPLAVQLDLWAAAGIGPARIAVMRRAAPPRISLLGRVGDSPAGTAFLACHAGTAMVHAIEVAPKFRRRGLGRQLILAAADWAARRGARDLALLVTAANVGANALYAALEMDVADRYHYRSAT